MGGDVGSAEYGGVTWAEPIAQVKDYGRALGLGGHGWGLTMGAAVRCAWSAGPEGVGRVD